MLVSETFYSLEKMNTLFLNSNIRYVGCQKSKKSVKSFLPKSATQKCNYWTGKQIGSSHLKSQFWRNEEPISYPSQSWHLPLWHGLEIRGSKGNPIPSQKKLILQNLEDFEFWVITACRKNSLEWTNFPPPPPPPPPPQQQQNGRGNWKITRLSSVRIETKR